MTMLAVINQVKANFKRNDPEGYYAMYPNERPAGIAPVASAAVYSAPVSTPTLAPVVAATPVAAAEPIHSAGGQIPIPNAPAPYVAAAPAPAPTPAKPLDKKWLIGGAVVLLVLFVLIIRR